MMAGKLLLSNSVGLLLLSLLMSCQNAKHTFVLSSSLDANCGSLFFFFFPSFWSLSANVNDVLTKTCHALFSFLRRVKLLHLTHASINPRWSFQFSSNLLLNKIWGICWCTLFLKHMPAHNNVLVHWGIFTHLICLHYHEVRLSNAI